MSFLRIPVSLDTPSYRLRCTLSGVEYVFRFDWNGRADRWYLDLLTVDLLPIARGLKLIALYPLLQRSVSPLRPPGDFFVFATRTPGFSDLGRSATLLYVEPGS
jgi:hypothetical protein